MTQVPFPSPVEVGGSVVFTDEKSVDHPALVTAVWGSFEGGGVWTEEELSHVSADVRDRFAGTHRPPPSLNLVFVSQDERNRDPYGRQIERRTSVPHQSAQGAPGMFWRNA